MKVGNQNKCFIIAEAGVNHNGDVRLAKELIVAAKEAGADAVKFQTWITELIVTEDSAAASYQEANTGVKSQYELLKSLELKHEDFVDLKAYAEEVGILFLSTPDEEVSADFLVDLGIDLIKVGSGELTNLPFIHFLAGKNLPMILSTGMATLAEVKSAVDTVKKAGVKELTLLHCVSNYPADPTECNLRAMATMRESFGCGIGYSDHTMGIEMCIAAVALGAEVIEKHLTLSNKMEGPDHLCSSEPAEFAQMVKSIRNVESGMGDGVKRPTASELETKKVVNKEIVAKRGLTQGEVIKIEDLSLKRGNGSGLSADHLGQVIGKVLKKSVAEDEVILIADVEVE